MSAVPTRPSGGRLPMLVSALLLLPVLLGAASVPWWPAVAGDALLPPLSPGHPAGTDDLGRDLLTLLARAAAVSLPIGLAATVLAVGIGLPLGLVAGLGSERLDDLLTRGAELLGAVPALLLAIVAAAVLPPSAPLVALVIGMTGWPIPFRVARAVAASMREGEIVRAATALGASRARIVLRHLLPDAAPPVLANAGVLFGGAVTAEAAIAFVGLGDPAHPSWGRMIAEGLPLLERAPWLTILPAAALTGTAVGIGLGAMAAGGRSPHHGSR